MAHKKASHLAPEEANASGPLYVEHVLSAGVTPRQNFLQSHRPTSLTLDTGQIPTRCQRFLLATATGSQSKVSMATETPSTRHQPYPLPITTLKPSPTFT